VDTPGTQEIFSLRKEGIGDLGIFDGFKETPESDRFIVKTDVIVIDYGRNAAYGFSVTNGKETGMVGMAPEWIPRSENLSDFHTQERNPVRVTGMETVRKIYECA